MSLSIPEECMSVLNLMHSCEVTHGAAAKRGARAYFNARKQYVMTEESFQSMVKAFAVMLDDMATKRPDDVYTREKKSELEFSYRFDYLILTLTYNRHLGGAFCVINDAWDAIDAGVLDAEKVISNMLRTH